MRIPLAAPSYETRSEAQSIAQLKNWFVVENPSDEENPFVLYPTPGVKVWKTFTGANQVRQLFEHKGTLYAVVDNTFYSLTTAAVETSRGTLNTSVGRVSIAAIENEIAFVDGLDGYSYKTDTNTFAQITDVDFPNLCKTITAQDQYFMVENPDTGQFYLSGLANGTVWSAADLATAEGKPDNLISVFSHRRFLWLFGQYTTEIWYNSANVDFPFEKQNGIFIEYGLVAAYAVAEAANNLFWLGRNKTGAPVILQSNGFEPKIVSTRSINYLLGTYGDISDAYALSYVQEGHEFVVFSFPAANVTWVYDVTTEQWHERDYYNGIRYGYWHGNCVAYFNNKILIGSRDSGTIYELDLATYTDNSQRIRRKLISDHLDLDMRRGCIYNLQIRIEPGIGLTASQQGDDPQIMLRVSKDYGNTWGNEMWRSPGKIGEYLDRCVWTRLGEGRSFTFELTATDPVKWVIHGARADVSITKD